MRREGDLHSGACQMPGANGHCRAEHLGGGRRLCLPPSRLPATPGSSLPGFQEVLAVSGDTYWCSAHGTVPRRKEVQGKRNHTLLAGVALPRSP